MISEINRGKNRIRKATIMLFNKFPVIDIAISIAEITNKLATKQASMSISRLSSLKKTNLLKIRFTIMLITLELMIIKAIHVMIAAKKLKNNDTLECGTA